MAPSARTVLFLGAGASTPFGIPVTSEILPEVLRRARKRGGDAELRKGLEAFLPALFDRQVPPPLIVDLLSVMDELIRAGNAPRPGVDVADLVKLRVQLEHAVAEVLVEPERPAEDTRARVVERLVEWIATAPEHGRFVTVVSTNYDFSMEKRLLARVSPSRLPRLVDFGFTWRNATGRRDDACPRPTRPWAAIYKLHGSLNWLSCPLCGHVYIHPQQPIFRGAQRHGHRAREHCTCGHAPLRHVIVTPTMIRDVRNPNLLTLWQSALEALRTADEWVIIGYSMPAEDLAIRSMLLRAYTGRERPPRVTVVQRRAGEEVEARYRLFFPEMGWRTDGLDGFVRGLKRPRRRR